MKTYSLLFVIFGFVLVLAQAQPNENGSGWEILEGSNIQNISVVPSPSSISLGQNNEKSLLIELSSGESVIKKRFTPPLEFNGEKLVFSFDLRIATTPKPKVIPYLWIDILVKEEEKKVFRTGNFYPLRGNTTGNTGWMRLESDCFREDSSGGWKITVINPSPPEKINNIYISIHAFGMDSGGQVYIDNLVQKVYDQSLLIDGFGDKNPATPITEGEIENNYPNPFNPSTKITYRIGGPNKYALYHVRMYVVDVLGRVVRVLLDEQKPAGNYMEEFDGKDLSSGIYFVRMEINNPLYIRGNKISQRKIVLLK